MVTLEGLLVFLFFGVIFWCFFGDLLKGKPKEPEEQGNSRFGCYGDRDDL